MDSTDHRAEALRELQAASTMREMLGDEYARKPRDYDRIGELRFALKNALGFAQVQALLALEPTPVVDPWPDTHVSEPPC